MSFIDLLNNHASAIFGAIGAIFGFFTNYFFKKFDRKNEISKEETKEYFKQKRIVLNESLKLISKYQLTIETLHDYYENDYGLPIKIVTKEDIYKKYFLKIFSYLHSHRLYLEESTIEKLDVLKKPYYDFIVQQKIIIAEYDKDEIAESLKNLTSKLYIHTHYNFNVLNEAIKYNELKEFRQRVSI